MKVLITRPRLDAQDTANLLGIKNIQSLIDPMTIVHVKNDGGSDISMFSDIIFTSKNGVRGFCQNYDRRDLKAWCVGDETAKLAQENSFQTVHSANGSADDLITLIISNTSPQTMLRIYGDYENDPLAKALQTTGYDIQSLNLYKVDKASSLSNHTVAGLRSGALTDIFIYSPNSAQILSDNIHLAQMQDACLNLTVWCISERVAAMLDSLSFKEVIVSEHPTQTALLDIFMQRNGLDG